MLHGSILYKVGQFWIWFIMSKSILLETVDLLLFLINIASVSQTELTSSLKGWTCGRRTCFTGIIPWKTEIVYCFFSIFYITLSFREEDLKLGEFQWKGGWIVVEFNEEWISLLTFPSKLQPITVCWEYI